MERKGRVVAVAGGLLGEEGTCNAPPVAYSAGRLSRAWVLPLGAAWRGAAACKGEGLYSGVHRRAKRVGRAAPHRGQGRRRKQHSRGWLPFREAQIRALVTSLLPPQAKAAEEEDNPSLRDLSPPIIGSNRQQGQEEEEGEEDEVAEGEASHLV